MQKLKGVRVERKEDGTIKVTPQYHGKARSTITATAQSVVADNVESAVGPLGEALVAKGVLKK